MNLWSLCNGETYRQSLELRPFRVVESQHGSSSRDLVDSVEEHDLLEDMLEASKPAIVNRKHYLIFTPFRYPPLKHGSRFGQIYERSLWYGSLDLQTALTEVAYYRLKFFQDCDADLGSIEIPMTTFEAFIKTSHGIDLTKPPFNDHQDKISNKNSYEYSQPLGSAMRHCGIEAFVFTSARVNGVGRNVAAFTPDVFQEQDGQYIFNMQQWRCWANKQNIEFSRDEILNKQRVSFSIFDFK